MSVKNSSDVEIIQRCKSGDTRAYRDLVHKYQGAIYNAAYAILGDSEEAIDAAQSAFVKAWEKLDTYDHSRKFFSWLYRIAVNEALNRKRDNRIQRVLVDENLSESSSPEEELVNSEEKKRLRSAISDLPDDQQVVVLMRYFEEMSYQEIGVALDLPEVTVKSRLYEARQKLRRALK